jgi:hypothetical protein
VWRTDLHSHDCFIATTILIDRCTQTKRLVG